MNNSWWLKQSSRHIPSHHITARIRIKTLLAVLPITITALRNRPLSPQHLTDGAVAPLPCVAACGVRLPEMWDVLGETDTPGGGGQGGQEWGTALGCAALTLDLLATYLRAPQLHHLAFQARMADVLCVLEMVVDNCGCAVFLEMIVDNCGCAVAVAHGIVVGHSPHEYE